jgi:hypothetical protein
MPVFLISIDLNIAILSLFSKMLKLISKQSTTVTIQILNTARLISMCTPATSRIQTKETNNLNVKQDICRTS